MDYKHIKAALEDGRRLPWWVMREIRSNGMSNLRLFCVRNRKTNDPLTENGEVMYFSNKMEAKHVRDTMHGGETEWKVSKGVDHRDFRPDAVAATLAYTPKKGHKK